MKTPPEKPTTPKDIAREFVGLIFAIAIMVMFLTVLAHCATYVN